MRGWFCGSVPTTDGNTMLKDKPRTVEKNDPAEWCRVEKPPNPFLTTFLYIFMIKKVRIHGQTRYDRISII
jgi:hypothetical protein